MGGKPSRVIRCVLKKKARQKLKEGMRTESLFTNDIRVECALGVLRGGEDVGKTWGGERAAEGS